MAGNSPPQDRKISDDRYFHYPPFDAQYDLTELLKAALDILLPSTGSNSMSSLPPPVPAPDRYIVIHVATTCDEHGVYVTKDSAEVIEIGWILVDAKTFDEVGIIIHSCWLLEYIEADKCSSLSNSFTTRASWSSPSILP